MKHQYLSIAFIIFLFSGNILVAQPNEFHLIRETVIGGEGGWDYLTVDSTSRRIFISHGNRVEVLDVETHERIGTIVDTKGVHGIAIVSSAGRGITSNGRTNSATIFDLQTLSKIVELPTGQNPDALLYDPYSERIFIFNHSGGSATAIDIATAKVTGTIKLGGEGVEAGVSDGNGTIYVNLEDSNEIVSFDSKTLHVKNRWSVAPGEEPTGLAYDPQTKRLFSVCHNELMVILDADNGNIVDQVKIGKHVDGVTFDPASKFIITSNGEGTLTVVGEISPTRFKVVETVKTAVGARTIAFDPKTQHVFVSTAQYGEPPAPTTEIPNPRPNIVSGTFKLLEYGKK